MKSYLLSLPASASTQVIRDTGRGKLLSLMISHAESSAQDVSLYDRDGNLLSVFTIHPGQSPLRFTFLRPPFWWTNGLFINTGNCTVTATLVY